MKLKSGLEKKVYRQLKRAKVPFKYEGIAFPYVLARRYFPDFTIQTKSGKIIYVEVKGYLRPEDRAKLAAVRKGNPTVDLRILFGRDNKLHKNAKLTYTGWANKHGIPWCIGSIPRSWLEE